MPAPVKRILELARAEIGVKEVPAGSNNVKYNTAYYGGKVSGPYPWCAVFLWWLFQVAESPELYYDGGRTASCPTLASWAKRKGQFVTGGYLPGDLILFSFDTRYPFQHVGILEFVGMDGSLTTIDGNTSMTSDDNGGAVMRRTRSPRYAVGAFRPAYAEDELPDTSDTYTVKAGDTLSGIAKTYKTTVAALVALNAIVDANVIRVGQVLKIPSEAKAQPADPAAGLYAADIKVLSTLNIRQGPGTHYLSLGSLFCGETIQVTGQTGDWYTVKHNGKTGYCAVKYLARAQTLKGTAKSGLRIREKPVTGKQVGAIPYGAAVTAWGLSGGWFRVKRGDVIGYASAEYLH